MKLSDAPGSSMPLEANCEWTAARVERLCEGRVWPGELPASAAGVGVVMTRSEKELHRPWISCFAPESGVEREAGAWH